MLTELSAVFLRESKSDAIKNIRTSSLWGRSVSELTPFPETFLETFSLFSVNWASAM